ncbi:MAG: YigZ family protein [Chloroflexi bacterium]|nr:YigZ family protein [Chloroflexota bacterium]
MQPDTYIAPVGQAQASQVIKNSRFIGTAQGAEDADAAQGCIAELRSRYPDASHHAWAYRVGVERALTAFSDDGEPGGTAGRPILAVLEGSGLSNTVVVVTRYFGGTKLGAGGLVRAYSGTASLVLAELSRAEYAHHQIIRLPLDYAQHPHAVYLASQLGVPILETAFKEHVELVLAVRPNQADVLQQALGEVGVYGLDWPALLEAERYLPL